MIADLNPPHFFYLRAGYYLMAKSGVLGEGAHKVALGHFSQFRRFELLRAQIEPRIDKAIARRERRRDGKKTPPWLK